MNLNSATILITGGATGIGFEMAKQLIALGNTVIVTGRSNAKLEAAKRELPTVHTCQSDVCDLQSVSELYERVTADFPELNIIINNAGMMSAIDFNDAEPDQICDEVDVDLCGPMRMVQVFLPHLKTRPEAAIVNVTSGLAFITFTKAPVYSASKIGLHAYTKTLRLQLKESGVKVFELAPPKTSRPMFKRNDPGAENGGNKMPEMPVPRVVEIMIRNMKKNKYEILPGMSKMLKLAGRFTL